MAKIISSSGFSKLSLMEEGVEFEVDEDNIANSSDDSFDEECFDNFKYDVVDTEGTNKPRSFGGANIPFKELKKKMTPVNSDNKILKELINAGSGAEIHEKSVILLHYELYLEGAAEPFDSTRLRKKHHKFLSGEGNVFPGFELAVQSMKKEEFSRFIIHPDYAYGRMGCAPRIPGNSEILCEIQIVNVFVSKEAVEFEDLPPEEQKKAPFERIAKVYHIEIEAAKDFFKHKQFKPAIDRYRKTARLLQDVFVANEEEDEKRKHYLNKLYNNLALCYINVQDSRKAIIYASLALKEDPNNDIALYRKGLALFMEKDFEKSLSYLHQAKNFRPHDTKIAQTIKEVDEKRRLHTNWERDFCRKMWNEDKKSQENKFIIPLELRQFSDNIKQQLLEFVSSEESELLFSPGHSDEELDIIKDLAHEHDNLSFVTLIHGREKINKVAKTVKD